MSNPVAKNIVLLSDGTGNSAKAVFKTNVWRLFQLLDLRDPRRQVAFYDDGVGTSSFKLFAALGGIFGFGLKRNVIAIYSFCCRNYKPGDRIYCFGFSRGAFTIRIVAAMIAGQGLVAYDDNEADLARFAADAYRRYRRRYNSGILRYLGKIGLDLRGVRDWGIRTLRRVQGVALQAPPAVEVESVHFVGIWDTVDAYGGPIEEMTRAIDYWIWPLSMPDQFMNSKIHRACHALAIEEERDAFRPVIWDERYVWGRDEAVSGRSDKKDWLFGIDHDPRSAAAKLAEPPPHLRTDLPPRDRERISQVWFTGVHSDIGGGYPQDGLSYVTLDWMLDRAQAYGLVYLDGRRRLLYDPEIDPLDTLNDSRKGLAAYYRYKPRNLREIYDAPPYKLSLRYDVSRIKWLLHSPFKAQTGLLADDLHPSLPQPPLPPVKPTIHRTVFERIGSGPDHYAPVVVPAAYRVTDETDTPVDALHPLDHGHARTRVQDDVWNWVWLRRVVYFATMFALLFVAAIPYFVIYWPRVLYEPLHGLVNPLVNGAAAFLPKFLDPWFVAFRDSPGLLVVGVAAALGLTAWGTSLQRTIRDAARIAWNDPSRHKPVTGWRATVYSLRRQGWYVAGFYLLKTWIFPFAIMFWLFWWLGFGAANTAGLFCKETLRPIEVEETEIGAYPGGSIRPVFETRHHCYPTALTVAQGETYQIVLVVGEAWSDGGIPATPAGFGYGTWTQLPGIPFKRLIWSNWFAPIVRVGSTGLEEHLPAFQQETPGSSRWTARFTARSDGEVFVYVNDTSIMLPWLLLYRFYFNNKGNAVVSLKKL
ncbi:DUF2235 domain-containing protein [Bradyrhizobium sp. HKCCYLRH3097]|uniref:DUF2235 domain-containing protein n=1 Tax=Bradyrhizobium sp. HKCCYLRH3097 TaxID=3420752 RepID=UPI003EB9F873